MAHLLLQADALHLPLADRSVDLVFGSPPYVDRRTYGVAGIARKPMEWVQWMLAVTTEALRVSRGPVLWVAAGDTVKRCYRPVCEGLMWEWWKRGGESHLLRPCFWHRVGIAGSGGDQWFRSDIEYVMCFKRPGKLPWTDNTAMGHPPKWAPGGKMSHRLTDGTRTNQWGKTGEETGTQQMEGGVVRTGKPRPSHVSYTKGQRQVNGEIVDQNYRPPVLANPGNMLRVLVGGGMMGHPLCHENEAPFPVGLPEFFIRSLCPPDGICLDPFSGSGTTVEAALKHGRRGIGIDLRRNQCELAHRRIEHPHAPVPKKKKPAQEYLPLFD